MGQYFKCITEDEFGVKKYSMQRKGFDYKSADSYKIYIGLKLIEHSYIGNALTDSISHSLFHHPIRVAWVGDYAVDLPYEQVKDLNPDFPIVKGAYNTFLKEVLEGDDDIGFETEKGEFDYKGKYLINYSKKEYLSFDKYIKKITERYNAERYNAKNWYIYPVSLLTAIGNDLGAGGYSGRTFHEEVGTWTYDLLSIEDEVPEGYKEKSVLFFQVRYR